jgi:hypothetical protein
MLPITKFGLFGAVFWPTLSGDTFPGFMAKPSVQFQQRNKAAQPDPKQETGPTTPPPEPPKGKEEDVKTADAAPSSKKADHSSATQTKFTKINRRAKAHSSAPHKKTNRRAAAHSIPKRTKTKRRGN